MSVPTGEFTAVSRVVQHLERHERLRAGAHMSFTFREARSRLNIAGKVEIVENSLLCLRIIQQVTKADVTMCNPYAPKKSVAYKFDTFNDTESF